MGLVPVPLWKGQKTPRIEELKPYLDRQVPDSELDQIDWQAGNVGVVTGKTSGIIVVDEDEEDALKEQGFYIPTGTPTVKTPHGSHYYFKYPADIGHVPNAIKFADGIDLKADGGYVVAPVSEGYEWVVELPEDLDDLPECPKWLLNIINPPEIDYEALRAAAKALASSSNDVTAICAGLQWFGYENYGVHPDWCTLMDYAIEATQAAFDAQEIGMLLSDVKAEKVEWLWDRRIPLGKITILDGDPGLGKSVMTMDLAARVSRGADFPPDPFGNVDPLDTVGTLEGGNGVVIMSAEDGLADTIKPRLEAAGALCSKIVAIASKKDGSSLTIPEDIATIEAAIKQVDAKMLIVDPLMAFLSGKANSDQEVRKALTPLKEMAERTGIAVLLVRHLNKQESTKALYRGGGSIGIIGAARAGLVVDEHPDDKDKRVLAVSKSNLARKPESITYTIQTAPTNEAAMVVWGEMINLDAEQLINPDDSERTKAKAYLLEELEDGPQPATDMFAGAKEKNISESTLKRAKSDLGIRSEKTDGKWHWIK